VNSSHARGSDPKVRSQASLLKQAEMSVRKEVTGGRTEEVIQIRIGP